MGKSLKEYGDMMKNNKKEDEAKVKEKSAAAAFEEDYEEPELTADDDIQLSELPISPMILEKELERGHLIALRAQEEFIYVVQDDENNRYHLFTHTFGEEAAGRIGDALGLYVRLLDSAFKAFVAGEEGEELMRERLSEWTRGGSLL